MFKSLKTGKSLLALIAAIIVAAMAAGCGGGGGGGATSSSTGAGYSRVGASVRFGSSVSSRIARTPTSGVSLLQGPYLYQECGDFITWMEAAAQTATDSTAIPVYLSVIEDPQYIVYDPLAFSYSNANASSTTIVESPYGELLASTCATVDRALGRVIVYRNSGTFTINNVLAGSNHVLTAVAFTGSTDANYQVITLAKIVPAVVAGSETSGIVVSPESTLAAYAALTYASNNTLELSAVPTARITAIEAAVESLFPSGFSFGDPVVPTGMNAVTFTSTSDFESTATGTLSWINEIITISDTLIELPTSISCSVTAMAHVQTARSYLFKSTITEADFTAAKTAADAALAESPNCADANFISALLDLGGEYNRVVTTLMANPQTVFPVDNYALTSTTVGRAINRAVQPVVSGLPRVAGVVVSGFNSQTAPSAYQAELEANTLAVLNGALAKLDKVRTAIASDSTWGFTYYKDPANPSLGTETITANDIDLIAGSYKLVVGWVNYLMAYNLDTPVGYATADPCPAVIANWSTYPVTYATDTSIEAISNFNTCLAADTNSDGILTPAEYFPPSPFGTTRTGGAAYLTAAQTNIVNGFALLNSAATNILAAATPSLGGLPLTSTLLTDANNYKHFLTELRSSFAGTATTITWFSRNDCWTSYVSDGITYYTSHQYEALPGDTQTCAATFEVQPAVSLNINLGAMFGITDLRTDMFNYVLSGSEYMPQPSTTIGNDFNGVFPGGFQGSMFQRKQADYYFNFSAVNSSNAPIYFATGTTATLTIGSKIISAPSGWSNLGGVQTTSIQFVSPFNTQCYYCSGVTTLPTLSDYISVDGIQGTSAILTVSGYQPVTIMFYDGNFYGTVVLSPIT